MSADSLYLSCRCRSLPRLIWVFVLWLGQACGWQDCTISPDDKWRRPAVRTPALRMRYEFPRRYTCSNQAASFEAASYFFDSPCTGEGFFDPDRILSCLEDRRVVFMGDSLSVQQADSLVGMLGWHPYWIESTNPYNGGKGDANGKPIRLTIKECWRQDTEEELEGMAICWDLYERDFPPAPTPATAAVSEGGQDGVPTAVGTTINIDEGATQEPRTARNGTSVHMRDFHSPTGSNWFSRAVKDFNETRASDVFVVNFGAHYEETPEGDEAFKGVVFPILDEMAEIGKTATVVWREISPVHFPSPNASYENFDVLDSKQKRGACCTGTPPRLFARNEWVEDYLAENGLTDTVKLLKIYDMSLPRAAAHHTCHMAPPSTMDYRTPEARRASQVCNSHPTTPDCRHWSAPGVVEEWNALLLHHLCPAG